jgi:glutathione S-transferase
LRGWLMMRMSGIPFTEIQIATDTADARAELLLLSPSILVPCLVHEDVRVWDTLAIGEYLNEVAPQARLLPQSLKHRAHCRAICGEMHSGFSALRASLPMNIKARMSGFRIWSKAQLDIDRVTQIWQECLSTHGGPYLFGAHATLADAMYAPVVTRFMTYGVSVDQVCRDYCDTILAMPDMKAWTEAALAEPDDIEELDVEF